MAAYNATSGFVALDEDETRRTGRLFFSTPAGDPIVVTARCTRVMLDDRILETMAKLSDDSADGDAWAQWSVPVFTWVNGVPGCGKTTWVVETFDENNDIVVTTTTEAAKELRSRLTHKVGGVRTCVRTMASVLVNGFKKTERARRLTVDEALMNHFGAVVMAARLANVEQVALIGDINQIPYIDRENLFKLQYHRPNLILNVGKELNCSYRCPQDVSFALKDVYTGMYSSSSRVRSLEIVEYKSAPIPRDSPNTLYLTHTQEEKGILNSQGFGSGLGSRTLTIHESQGLTFEHVVIIQTKSSPMHLHESIPHAVVALSRHTNTCVYYTDNANDAIGRFVGTARRATSVQITEHNLKIAMSHRDMTTVRKYLPEVPDSVANSGEVM